MKSFESAYTFNPFMELRGTHVTDTRLFWEINSGESLWSKVVRFFKGN